MPKSPAEVVRAILDNPTNLDTVKELVAPDATYVSLSYDNPDLKKLMPWAGTTQGGAEAVVSTYTRVGRYWANKGFHVEEVIEGDEKVPCSAVSPTARPRSAKRSPRRSRSWPGSQTGA